MAESEERLSRQEGFDRYPTVEIGGFIRTLPREVYPTDLDLQIYLPWQMDAQPEKVYPVVYLTDGLWDAPLVCAIYAHLLYDRVVPEFLLVGLCHGGCKGDADAVRKIDLAPAGREAEAAERDFLARLRRQVIPLVEREYPVDTGFRAIAGTSIGAHFALSSIFRAPGLFHAVVAVSPVVDAREQSLMELEAAFFEGQRRWPDRLRHRAPALPLKLFMAVGERDVPVYLEAAGRFDARLDRRRYRYLHKRLHIAAGEGHGGVKPEGLNRGLRFIFREGCDGEA
jgi:uncharacterized protein